MELQAILALIESEISYSHTVITVLDKTDAEALDDIRKLMDCPALQDPWDMENNYRDFGEAITGLIGLIKAGQWKGQLVTKPQSKYNNHEISDQLNVIYNQLRVLRQLYRTHVQSGEIRLNDNACDFHLPETAATFDKLRNAINAGFNNITKPYNLSALPNVS